MADHDHIDEKVRSAATPVDGGAPAARSEPEGSPAAASAAASTAAPEAGAETGRSPDEPIDEMAVLRTELTDAKDRLLRERAELENYKKRAAREKADAVRYGAEKLLRELLPVIDNLDRATDQLRAANGREDGEVAGAQGGSPAGDQDVDPVVEGIELVRRGFVETLERHGVTVVGAHGATFDPALHEAIGYVESEQPANTVIDEHQCGYTLHGRLLRPALVTVGKGPSQTPADDSAQNSAQNPAQDGVEKPPNDG